MSESSITKRAVAQSLKSLMREKDFGKISVSDITLRCGINRQTFYYHFADKYDLLNWIYYHELFADAVEGLELSNWDAKFLELLKAMERDGSFYQHALRINGEGAFSDYLFLIMKQLIAALMPELEEFGRDFYAYGMVGVIVRWATDGMSIPPARIAEQTRAFLAGTTENLLKAQ